jgi:hypothetical protein
MKLIEIKENASHRVDLIPSGCSEKEMTDILITTLNKNCKQILSLYKKIKYSRVLWRGEGTSVNFYKNKIWEKRVPLWLPKYIHDASVEASKELKLDANRENSIFCAPKSIASNWGSGLYMIFPTDGFKCTWFNKPMGHSDEEDHYMYDKFKTYTSKFLKSKNINNNIYDASEKLNKDSNLKKEYINYIKNMIQEFEPVNSNLEKALLNTRVTEYLITGKSYYGVNSYLFDDDENLMKNIINNT